MTLTLSDLRDPGPVPDDGVVAGPRAGRPRRLVFTAQYKARILSEYEATEEPGGKGALLRRGGLYSSHLVEWRSANAYARTRPPRTPHPRWQLDAALPPAGAATA